MINYLKSLFDIFGNPKEMVLDRGTAFVSNEFAHFLESLKLNTVELLARPRGLMDWWKESIDFLSLRLKNWLTSRIIGKRN